MLTRTVMNVRISVLLICVEAIVYLLLYNLRDCTFNNNHPSQSACYEIADLQQVIKKKVQNRNQAIIY